MSRLTRLSLASRAVVMLLTVLIVGIGGYATRSLKQELIPSIDTPRASVLSIFPGAAPEVVEREVSKPIEDAVKGVAGVSRVTSRSASGISQVRIEWEFGENADRIENQIRAAVDGTKSGLPDEVTPTVIAGGFEDVPVVVLAVSSADASAVLSAKLRDLAVPRLKTIAGVRDVAISGEEKREVVVTLRPADVDRNGVPVATLPQTFQANGVSVPAGSVPSRSATLDVQVGKTLTTLADVRAIQVQGRDGPVTLGAIADVREQTVETTSVSRANGKPALTLAVTKAPSGNTVTVSQGVREAIPVLVGQLGAGATFSTVFDQAPYIEDSIHDLSIEGGLGLAFAVLVIMVFLASLRPTVITAISIPLSLLIAMIGLWMGGYTLNILTLGALTVAIGRVVDDSIVVIENIKRHQSVGDVGTGAIVRAVREVAGAVTSSTLTTVAVFLPIGLVSGQAGALFRPFAVTVTIALLASLLVSLTVVPVLASWFMRVRGAEVDTVPATGTAVLEGGGPSAPTPTTRLQQTYLPALGWALGHRTITLVLALLIFVATLALAPRLKTEFIGNAGETTLQVSQTLPAGTSLAQTDAAARRLEALVATDPAVRSYQTTVGGDPSQVFFGAVSGANKASMAVTLQPGSKGAEVADRLRRDLSARTGLGVVEVVVGGGTSEVAVRVESPDRATLRAGSDAVVAMLKGIDGLTAVKSDLTDEKSMLSVDLDQAATARAGMAPAQVGLAVAQAVKGSKVGSVTLGDRTLDLVLRSRAPVRTVAELRSLRLPVTQKQDADAKKAAGEAVQARQEEAQRRQQADALAQAADQERQIQAGRAKAAQQVRDLSARLSRLQAQLRALLSRPPAPVVAPTGPVVPGGPSVPVPPPTADPRVGALQLQIQQVQAGLAAARAQVSAADESLAKSRAALATARARQAEAQDLQQAAKDAAEATGTGVRLSDVATVKEITAPASIARTDGARSATVTALPIGADLGGVTATIQGGLDRLRLADGVSATIGGVSQAQRESFSQLGVAMLVAIAIVYLIMVATFRSLLQPLILLVSVPFAATGALALLLATDTPLGVPAMIGLLMLIGIVVTNAIVLIDLINQYRRGGAGVAEAVRDGARLRLRPIIMTALATIFALMPMALGVTGGGIFISRPLAIVVIGGLLSSTVLTLILVPVLYDLSERLRARRRGGRGGPVHAGAQRSAGRVDPDPDLGGQGEPVPDALR